MNHALVETPKTGDSVKVAAKAVPHFKPGKALRDAVNDALLSNNDIKTGECNALRLIVLLIVLLAMHLP